MAINPYDKWPQSDIKPLDFGQLMQAQQYINKAEADKLNRDLAAYEDLSKIKTTHIQQIPGSVDEVRQKAIEEEQQRELDKYADLYNKGKIGYKDLRLGMIDIRNKIVNPVSLIGNENYKSWEKTQSTINNMKATGQGYSPALHANFLDASNFDSAAGHRWTKSPEAYQSAAIAETFYNNLTPFEDPYSGAQLLTPEMIFDHTKKNLPLIMNEPFTQQQIDIARSRGDQRPAQDIATEIWYNKGLEYQQQKYPDPTVTKGRQERSPSDPNSKFAHNPKPAEGEEISVEPTYKTWSSLNSDIKSNQESYDTHSSALYVAVPGKMSPNSPEYKKAEYIKWTDGNIYNKEELESYGFDVSKVQPKNYEYNQQHESEVVFSQGNLEDLGTAKKEIIRRAAQSGTGSAYNFIDKTGMINPETGEINLKSNDSRVPTLSQVAELSKIQTMTNSLENAGINVTDQDTPETIEAKFEEYLTSLKDSNPDLADDVLENFEENEKDRKKELLNKVHDYAKKTDPIYAQNFSKLVKYQEALDKETEKYFAGYNKIPKGWYFDPENDVIDKEWNGVLETAALDGSASFLDKKLNPLGAEGKNFVNSKEFIKESGLEAISGMKIESYYLTDKAGIFFRVRPYQKTKGEGVKLGNQMTFDIKGDLEQKFMWDYGITNGENDQAIQQKLEHTFKNTSRKATSIDLEGIKVAIRKTDVDGSYQVSIKNPVTDKIETETGITELSDVTRIVRDVLAGTNQFNNNVLIEGILNAENAGMQNIVNDSTGAAAAGYFQMSVKNNLEFFSQFGITNAVQLISKDFSTQKAIAVKYLDHIKSEALNTKVTYSDVVKDLGFSTSDILAATYFLGTGNLKNWLKTYSTEGVNAAEAKAVPGYPKNNMALMEYLNKVRKGAIKAQSEIKTRYSK